MTNDPSNFWHYVHIAKIEEKVYKWTNAAGVHWSLTFQEETDSKNFLYAVGKECPYYKDGYTTATLHFKTSQGTLLDGPSNEDYVKLSYVSNVIIGEYELTVGPSNAWHYVNITKKTGYTQDVFTWKNRAGWSLTMKQTSIIFPHPGPSWTLTFVEQPDDETLTFSVGDDCPYHDPQNGNYTLAKLHINATKGIEIEGPSKELYVKLKRGTSKQMYITLNQPCF